MDGTITKINTTLLDWLGLEREGTGGLDAVPPSC
jgi:hypothetical protein